MCSCGITVMTLRISLTNCGTRENDINVQHVSTEAVLLRSHVLATPRTNGDACHQNTKTRTTDKVMDQLKDTVYDLCTDEHSKTYADAEEKPPVETPAVLRPNAFQFGCAPVSPSTRAQVGGKDEKPQRSEHLFGPAPTEHSRLVSPPTHTRPQLLTLPGSVAASSHLNIPRCLSNYEQPLNVSVCTGSDREQT